MNSCIERLKNGIIDENPIFVLMLGMCPTLAVTTSAMNGIGMGLSTTVVLVMSNMLISILRKCNRRIDSTWRRRINPFCRREQYRSGD